jgi:hypothetical protein
VNKFGIIEDKRGKRCDICLNRSTGANFLLDDCRFALYHVRGRAVLGRHSRALAEVSEEAERRGIAESFKAITTEGSVVAGLSPIKPSGVSTVPVRQAAKKFLASSIIPDAMAADISYTVKLATLFPAMPMSIFAIRFRMFSLYLRSCWGVSLASCSPIISDSHHGSHRRSAAPGDF